MKEPKPTASYEAFRHSSYLSGNNAAYIEMLYEQFLKNPGAISEQWRHYFESLHNGATGLVDISHEDIREQFRQMASQPKMVLPPVTGAQATKQDAVDKLIIAYRRFGHLNATIDPLGSPIKPESRLALSHYGLSEADLQDTFLTRQLLDKPQATLEEILTKLKACYTGNIGVEYTRLVDEVEREWLREYVEQKLPAFQLSDETKRNILKGLTAAEGLEKYLDVKYPGQKRFSIEGADSLIPMLDELSHYARSKDFHEMVIAMAHRGRLNVLLNIMGQSPAELFQEFDGTKEYGMTTGDVKYHRGFSSDIKTAHGPMHLSLAFNPSHLEFICPVVMGSTRARQERVSENVKRNYACAVMIHGDAAFIGQGVVMETLSMSQTRAYHIGGTLHIILNNQVGFTTSDPLDARSSHYCSDLAKMIDAPIFHVNGDDVEATVAVTLLAMDYRVRFNKDIVIDLVCYRRHGHQEVDEPRATQPLMYQIIKDHVTTRALYADALEKSKVVSAEEIKQWQDDYRTKLDQGRQVVDLIREGLSEHYAANWTPYIGQRWRVDVDTSVNPKTLAELGNKLVEMPEGFVMQRNVQMIYDARRKMNAGELPLDWGYAEIMAYATLLREGFHVRLSGEDSRRGTFFHRHATVFDQNTGAAFTPLAQLGDQAKVSIYDSLLSEAGPLGFEYGYSTADPKTLVIWEAQFGDFANGAQVIIDQFISSGWQKWNRLSGLVMFLPHGYEGMGPEHSSARLERYLQLCAQENIQVIVPTTPAQIFHFLRRQLLRPYRKPLIVMTPKSLLRHKLAVSTLEDLSHSKLQLLIPEIDTLDAAKVRKVVLCSGKVYYELLTKRREMNIDDIAIVRIEQLYPFPYDELKAVFASYPNAKKVVWCQEEPKNQGAWFCTRHRLVKCLPQGATLSYAGRSSMAAPAGGYPSLHQKQQTLLIHKALNIEIPNDSKIYKA